MKTTILWMAAIAHGTSASAFVAVVNVVASKSCQKRITKGSRPTGLLYLSSQDGANPPPFGNWGSGANASVPATDVPVSPQSHKTTTTSSSSSPVATANAAATTATSSFSSISDAIATLSASQAISVRQIQDAIPDLVLKESLSWLDIDNTMIAGCHATLNAFDAPGSSNVAWLADVCVEGKLSSLTIFNGPLTNVPHLLSRSGIVQDDGNNSARLQLSVDLRPRAYGAYELVDATTGNYPGPEQLGRKARNDFFEKFGNDALKTILNPNQFEGPVIRLPPTELDTLTGGPLALHLSVSLTATNVIKIVSIRERVAALWLEWAALQRDTYQHRPGAPVNAQYVYDSKVRQNAYLALRSCK